MHVINRRNSLWVYLPKDIKGLLIDGELLVHHAEAIPHKVSDYSYLVFPFAKAYEGFLKKLFLDLDFIKEDEFYGDDIRIGRILNPYYIQENENLFGKLCAKAADGQAFAERMWAIWRRGRNQVFHYFPHNFRKLSYEEAMDIVNELLDVMDAAIVSCDLSRD